MTDSIEVVVGVIGRAHGVRGEVAIDVRTDEPERRFAPGTVLQVEGSARTFSVVRTRDHSGRLLAVFAELPDRTAAEQARGSFLVTRVDPAEPPADTEEFYDRQLVGLRAVTPEGRAVGTISSVLHLPGQDTLEIATADGPRLVPFVSEIVPSVDLAAGELVVVDLIGLLSETDD